MHETISAHKLRTGEEMSTLRVMAPDEEYKEAILSLIGHKGDFWLVPVREAMEGKITGIRTFCYLALLGGQIVGNITTAETLERPVGIFQHVYTRPEHRRKGIASFLTVDVLEDFKSRRGRALYLGTGYGSEAHRIYLRHGFRDLGEKTGYMRFLLEEDFDEKYYGGKDARVEDADWKHWPSVNALFSVEGGWYLRSSAFGNFGVCGFEGDYINLMLSLRQGETRGAKVLVSGDAAVGLAFVVPDKRWNYGVSILDFFVHPRFVGHASKLVRSLELGAGKTQSFAEREEAAKAETLEECGFELEATLKGQLRHPRGPRDVLVYSRRS
ncbi:MAG: GNAT family N-acetyltransferase [Candidatus Brockarchaeota archaeon]|nr:GNAT family N-acetyltransferase [Candidatus Brockarchaeota archaeon]